MSSKKAPAAILSRKARYTTGNKPRPKAAAANKHCKSAEESTLASPTSSPNAVNQSSKERRNAFDKRATTDRLIEKIVPKLVIRALLSAQDWETAGTSDCSSSNSETTESCIERNVSYQDGPAVASTGVSRMNEFSARYSTKQIGVLWNLMDRIERSDFLEDLDIRTAVKTLKQILINGPYYYEFDMQEDQFYLYEDWRFDDYMGQGKEEVGPKAVSKKNAKQQRKNGTVDGQFLDEVKERLTFQRRKLSGLHAIKPYMPLYDSYHYPLTEYNDKQAPGNSAFAPRGTVTGPSPDRTKTSDISDVDTPIVDDFIDDDDDTPRRKSRIETIRDRLVKISKELSMATNEYEQRLLREEQKTLQGEAEWIEAVTEANEVQKRLSKEKRETERATSQPFQEGFAEWQTEPERPWQADSWALEYQKDKEADAAAAKKLGENTYLKKAVVPEFMRKLIYLPEKEFEGPFPDEGTEEFELFREEKIELNEEWRKDRDSEEIIRRRKLQEAEWDAKYGPMDAEDENEERLGRSGPAPPISLVAAGIKSDVFLVGPIFGVPPKDTNQIASNGTLSEMAKNILEDDENPEERIIEVAKGSTSDGLPMRVLQQATEPTTEETSVQVFDQASNDTPEESIHTATQLPGDGLDQHNDQEITDGDVKESSEGVGDDIGAVGNQLTGEELSSGAIYETQQPVSINNDNTSFSVVVEEYIPATSGDINETAVQVLSNVVSEDIYHDQFNGKSRLPVAQYYEQDAEETLEELAAIARSLEDYLALNEQKQWYSTIERTALPGDNTSEDLSHDLDMSASTKSATRTETPGTSSNVLAEQLSATTYEEDDCGVLQAEDAHSGVRNNEGPLLEAIEETKGSGEIDEQLHQDRAGAGPARKVKLGFKEKITTGWRTVLALTGGKAGMRNLLGRKRSTQSRT